MKTIAYFKNLLKYRDLFWQLTFREIKARYKQSILGYAWAILVPLINLLVLSIVFAGLFKIPTGNIPYPIFLFVALVPWTFLTNSLTLATSSVLSNSSLITKVYLPREILPITAITARMIDLLLSSGVLIIFLIFFRIEFHPTIIYLPIILLVQLILMSGMAFFLSATNVFFRDIENVIGLFLMIWMYLTPIIYAPAMVPLTYKFIFNLNPMTAIINAYRDTILYGTIDWASFSYSILFSIVLFILGYIYFKKRSKYFADII